MTPSTDLTVQTIEKYRGARQPLSWPLSLKRSESPCDLNNHLWLVEVLKGSDGSPAKGALYEAPGTAIFTDHVTARGHALCNLDLVTKATRDLVVTTTSLFHRSFVWIASFPRNFHNVSS